MSIFRSLVLFTLFTTSSEGTQYNTRQWSHTSPLATTPSCCLPPSRRHSHATCKEEPYSKLQCPSTLHPPPLCYSHRISYPIEPLRIGTFWSREGKNTCLVLSSTPQPPTPPEGITYSRCSPSLPFVPQSRLLEGILILLFDLSSYPFLTLSNF